MQAAVRGDDAVAIEGAVGRVVVVQVAAEDVDVVRPGLVGRPAERLVHEVPDEAALAARLAAGDVPVLLEIAHGIAHRVRVLALDERFRALLQVSEDIVRGGVHRAVDVRVAMAFAVPGQGALVLHGTGRVIGLDPVVAGLEVGAVARLVAHAPDNDGGMVEVALHHPAVAGEVRLGEERILPEGRGTVAHAVGLDIAFVHHIQAILVAQGDPARVVGIVAGADGVDVQFLHDADVPDHLGLGDDIAAGGAQLVPVGALDEDGLAVHQQLVAHDLHGPETELEGRVLRQSLIRGRLHAEGIEVRGLGAPEGGIPDRPLIAGRPLDRTDLAGSQDALAGRIQDFHLHEGDTLGHFGLDLQAAVSAGGHVDVLDPLLLAGVDLHAAGDAGEAPEILVLQVGAVAPAEDLKGDKVLPRMDIFRQVEAGFELAVLAVAHHLAVHPHSPTHGRWRWRSRCSGRSASRSRTGRW